MNKLITQLKAGLDSRLDPVDLKAVVNQLEARASGNRLTRLFRKNGEFSITRTILIASWAVGLCLYVFGSLFVGFVIPLVEATVPAFDSAAFLAVTGAASSLYFANHNISVGKSSGEQ